MSARMRNRVTIILAVVLAVLGIAGVSTAATGAPTSTTPPATTQRAGAQHYAIDRPVCAVPAGPSAAQCYALQRVNVAKGTAGAHAYTTPANLTLGPAGGYTPADLASAYGYNPDVNRSAQVVAVVDWYDDPNALKDLNAFDTHYGLAQETTASFRKVNQSGQTAPLPTPNTDTSVEIALDVEAVRAVCHTCRILLVEAKDAQYNDLATAENTAAAMGATEISNSFGGAEGTLPPSVLAAFDHPGVVITASTGDDGWYGWDSANDSGASQDAASFPATDPDVVAVGGTTLQLNADGTRRSETVWNDNGPADQTADGLGATGGGCSTVFAAPSWQATFPGYAAAGCGGKRLAADIAAIADPETGFDVLDSYAYGQNGWLTAGGTSLSSPVTAAMFALAGGSDGAAYPAATLYSNATRRPSSLFDVIAGGSGYCGGASTAACSSAISGYGTTNPNALGYGAVDCSFPSDGAAPISAPSLSSECNAVAGYDGASGLGTPVGLGLFADTNPSVTITRPAALRLKSAATFGAAVLEPQSGVTVSSYAWRWGDGKSSQSTAPTIQHTYAVAGTYTVTLTVTDSAGQLASTQTSVTLGKAATVRYAGPATLRVARAGAFSVRGSTDPNTGARISSVSWKWGDGTTTAASAASHRYARAGTFTVTVVLTDTTGVRTSVTHRVTVTR